MFFAQKKLQRKQAASASTGAATKNKQMKVAKGG